MKRTIRFRVYPGRHTPRWLRLPRNPYWRVAIFPSTEQMFEFAERHPSRGDKSRQYAAIVMPVSVTRFVNRRWVRTPYLGDVLFHVGSVGMAVVSHEAVHMGTCFLRAIKRLKLGGEIDEHEELLAHSICTCANQIAVKLWDAGLCKGAIR